MIKTKAVKSLTLDGAISEATSCIGSLYPLTNFVACNALRGFEEIPFDLAMRKSTELFGAKRFLSLSDYRSMYETGRIGPADLEEAFHRNQASNVARQENEPRLLCISEMLDRISDSRVVAVINKQMVKWCAAYLDRTQAQWKPNAKNSLYSFWKELAGYDLSLRWHGVKNWSKSVDSLPEQSQEALENLLSEFEIQEEHIVPYLRRHVIQLPGYASYLKWRETENIETGILSDYLAIRMHYEKMMSQVISKRLYRCGELGLVRPLLESATASAVTWNQAGQEDYGPVWQEAYELNYRDRLLSSISTNSPAEKDGACCQLVFCIDVRSEPIRRQLEQIGPYSTYGFAGFFGMPMRLTELGSAMSFDLCPVLLKPEREVAETSNRLASAKKMSWQALKVSTLQLKKGLKSNLAGAFGLVELLGLFSVIPLALKTFFPSCAQKMWHSAALKLGGDANTTLNLSAFSLDEKLTLAEGTLKGIGLTDFGKVVIFCGHKSSSVNNPFASSLDCGACGGNGGAFSARLAADILNDLSVRERLSEKGIDIPADTRFIASEHDTTTDEFKFFDCETILGEHEEILDKLKEDLRSAGEVVRRWRVRTLPECSLRQLNDPMERASDWAQIAPEWGLAGNAAFIAAPRTLSKDTDLEGRVFLHSYEFSSDSEGKVLELIMTAPLVVAQWINMQYYLSTTDNEIFGSGSKVLHNVVGDFGVMLGAASDLRIGLPLQSLMTKDGFRHEPMRLLALIRAPLSAIDAVLEKHTQVRKLVVNRWIRLVALDPYSTKFYEADDCGKWRQIILESKNSRDVADGSTNVCFARQQESKPLLR